MGSSQSSPAKNASSSLKTSEAPVGGRGRKSNMIRDVSHGLADSIVSTIPPSSDSNMFIEETTTTETYRSVDEFIIEETDETESEDETDDEEGDEEWEERLRILEDARKLKQLAVFFLHPEQPVHSEPALACRCFFDRASAPPRLSKEESDEASAILEDAKSLKSLAVDYLHPEVPVVTADATACGRNYFGRPSAPEMETVEETDERSAIFDDLKALKQAAVDYMHPELPVVTSDGAACGRNYFTRASAPTFDSDEAEERERILEDAKMLKQLAVDFMHPELPVVTTDPCAAGRNYFTRPSAPLGESAAEANMRAEILADAKAFKQLAADFMHPELPVVIYATACGRNYFTRASAPEFESLEDAEAREQVMADAKALKKLAVEFLHPELPVTTSDATACGRNYFTRPSAPEQESFEEAEERAMIFADLQALKQTAIDYRHPELPVTTSDATACGRNFFTRPSAPTQASIEEAEERALIFSDLAALKQSAIDFLHPELPVVTNDPFACGRNFFSRPSAPQQESAEEMEDRTLALADAKALKQLAIDFMHPELPVVTNDPFACGRNFFTRASAPSQDTNEEAEERALVLGDAKALKQLAVDFHHPELPVVTSDPTACSRCYFSRASVPQQETVEEAEERALVLEDVKALKQLAVDYLHPELPVTTTDPTSMGRNYFDRPSHYLHDQMIHTFPPHDDDLTDHHHEHMDHFGMDEDLEMFADLREELTAPLEQSKNKIIAGSDVGSNLSRSPSSVMLFGEESIYD